MTPDELRTIREQHGLSQGALAQLLGYSQQQVSHLETGRRAIQARFVFLLKKMLPHAKKTEKAIDSSTT